MQRIQSPFTIHKQAPIAAALFAVVLAFAGVASADTMSPTQMSATHSHKGTKGNFTIKVATQVGGTILQPGDYQVKKVNSPSGPVLEFVHLFRNELASELVQADEEEVVARMQFTEQATSSPQKRTQLVLASNSLASNTKEAIGVEIRGNDIEYLIASQPTLSATSDTRVDCTNNGMHE